MNFRKIKFHGSSATGTKRVAEEEIIEVEDLAVKKHKPNNDSDKRSNQFTAGTFKKPQVSKIGLNQKSALANLVKRKTPATATTATVTATTTTTASATATATATALSTARATATATATVAAPSRNSQTSESTSSKPAPKPSTQTAPSAPNALSLLSGYDNYSDSDESE